LLLLAARGPCLSLRSMCVAAATAAGRAGRRRCRCNCCGSSRSCTARPRCWCRLPIRLNTALTPPQQRARLPGSGPLVA